MTARVTKKTYIEYLIHTPVNYTASNLAEHLSSVSHDAVSDFLQRGKATAAMIWDLAQERICNEENGYLILDDSVQDKNYSQRIELVKKQYSGAHHRLVRGIGVVNLVHYHPHSSFTPIDYRIYAPVQDGKSKQTHAQEMIISAKAEKRIRASILLMDSFYASVENFKKFHRMELIFVSQLKANRLVSLTKEGGYMHLQDLKWDEQALKYGISVKLKELPFRLQLFKVVAPNGDIDWVVTNYSEQITADVIKSHNDIRWKIEEMHRELKQLTGIQQCQSRRARSQRNHISYCYQAWFALKRKAQEMSTTVYAVRTKLFSDYLQAVLLNPVVPAYELT